MSRVHCQLLLLQELFGPCLFSWLAAMHWDWAVDSWAWAGAGIQAAPAVEVASQAPAIQAAAAVEAAAQVPPPPPPMIPRVIPPLVPPPAAAGAAPQMTDTPLQHRHAHLGEWRWVASSVDLRLSLAHHAYDSRWGTGCASFLQLQC